MKERKWFGDVGTLGGVNMTLAFRFCTTKLDKRADRFLLHPLSNAPNGIWVRQNTVCSSAWFTYWTTQLPIRTTPSHHGYQLSSGM